MNSTFDEADLDRNGLIDLNEYQVQSCIRSTASMQQRIFLTLALTVCIYARRLLMRSTQDSLTSSRSTRLACSTTWKKCIP